MDPADYNLTSSDTLDDDNQSYIYYYNIDEKIILQKTSLTLYSIIFTLGIIGNGLVIWIAGFRMKKTISAVWFLNLAIADFLCCTALLLRITEWAHLFSMLSVIICIPSIILFTLNMSASVLLLTAMSIDRWVSVMWPFWVKVHRTRKRVRIVVAVTWVLSFFLSSLVFYLYGFWFHDLNEWCVFYKYRKLSNIKLTVQLIRLALMFLIPFLIIITSYVTIFFKLRKSHRPQRSQRPYRIITAVILCFFICWFPYYIWPLTPMYYIYNIQSNIMHLILITLACLNSCINPIIYVFMGPDFRHSFLRSIPFTVERALSEHPDDPCREEEEDCEQTCTKTV